MISLYLLMAAGSILLSADATTPVRPPAPKCRLNEEYSTCGTACPETCKNRNEALSCIAVCVEGCFCKKGYVRNDTGYCVEPDQCPFQCADPNEEYKTCGTACPKTCKNKDIKINCIDVCKEGCFCKDEYVRNDDRLCVKPDQCPNPCPTNQTSSTCAYHCPSDDCWNGGPVPQCLPPPPEYCTPGCRCLPGYKQEHSGKKMRCVRDYDCPPINCPGKNEISMSCAVCHDDSCQNRNLPKKPCNVRACGQPRCVCKPKFYRNDAGECVPECECPIECPKNEVYSDYSEECPPRDCESIGRQYKCAEKKYSPGCVCIDGYSRNANGTCIPSNQCPQAVCKSPNETFANCGVECSRCPTDDGPPVACDPPRPCRPGCVCGRLFRRDYNNRCVRGSECPAVDCTRPYEMFDECPSACLAEGCGDRDNQPTVCNTLVEAACNPRCVCRKGHFRSLEGICVPYDEC